MVNQYAIKFVKVVLSQFKPKGPVEHFGRLHLGLMGFHLYI